MATAKLKTNTTTRQAVLKPPNVELVEQEALLLTKALAAMADSPPKVKKSKLVRDSFTIPDHEYKLIHALKERALRLGIPLKKSELLRAGILMLAALPEVQFIQALNAVDIIKTGRPAKLK